MAIESLIHFATQRNTTHYCVKYARIRVFSDPFFPVYGQNLRICPYMGNYVSKKTRILIYFTQCTPL